MFSSSLGMTKAHVFILLCIVLLRMANKALCQCNDCYVSSRATYYAGPDGLGTPSGACGYGEFGKSLNGGDVACASNLYRKGVGCGACYQIRCKEGDLCTEEGVKIVITDMGQAENTDFILSNHAFSMLGRNASATSTLVSTGIIGIEFRRISCGFTNQNIFFKIDESSNFPSYLSFVLWYQSGIRDIVALDICEKENLQCKLCRRNHGAVWDAVNPPAGDLSVRFLVSDGEDDEQWITAVNLIPGNWTPGAVYDSGIQLQG